MAENVGGIEYTCSIELSQFMKDKRKLEDGLRDVDKSGDSLNLTLSRVASAVKVLAAAFAVVKVSQLADDMRLLESRVNVAAGSVEKGAAALAEINRIATATQSPVNTIAGAFGRLNQIMLDLGRSQRDTLELTELVAKAVKVSGASAQEAAAAQQQFAQALGAGKLNGDELRSILENAPYLARQIAEGMGVQIGALRELGEQGKLTSDVVIDALSKAADRINSDFAQLPQTFDAAFQALQDGGARGAKALDDVTGTSAALTGVTVGLTEAVNSLVTALENTNKEGQNLGRDETVKSWANSAKDAMYVLADAAQYLWEALSVLGRNVAFVFKGLGAEIGGIAAQAAAVARGEFAEAGRIGDMMKADAIRRRQELDAADQATLARKQSWSEKMRAAEMAASGGQTDSRELARRGRAVDGYGASAPKTSTDTKSKGTKKEPRDFLGEAWDASQKRVSDYGERNQNAMDRADERAALEKARADEKVAKDRERGTAQATSLAQGIIGDADPVAKIEQEAAAKQAALDEALNNQYLTEDLWAQATIELHAKKEEQLKAISEQRRQAELANTSMMLAGASQAFGSMAELIAEFGGKQSGAYKAMFAVSKAFAIAQGTIALYGAALKAMDDPTAITLPQKLANYGTVLAAGGKLLSTIKGANFGGGRQYGGPVSAGTMYRVNETGRPEMFTAKNGAQYMLPTASGQVTPANQVGGSGGGASNAPAQAVTVAPVFQGVAMPDGWFAVRPEAVADALKIAHRDGYLAGFRG